MGSIVSAACDCGYETEICVGGGMRNFTTHCSFPLYCPTCRSLFEGNPFEKKIACPRCGAERALPYDSDQLCHRRGQEVFEWNGGDEIGRRLELTEGDYLCPKCGRFAMTFVHVGCWD